MDTLTAEEMNAQPIRLVANALRGEPTMVTQDGQPMLMTVPLGMGLDALEVRLELAARLFDRDQISVRVAASIAGLPLGEMLSELSRRQIPVVRYSEDELKEEMKYLSTLRWRG